MTFNLIFIIDLCLDERIGDIDYSNVPFLLCIHDTVQYHSFGWYIQWTGILFGDEFTLLVSSWHGYAFYFTVSILLEKHVRLHTTLLLIFIFLSIVILFEGVSEMQLIHIRFICYSKFSSAMIHVCLEG